MKHIQSILFIFSILLGMSSCSTIADEMQDTVLTNLSDSTEVHTCILYMDAARPSYDENGGGSTRATGGQWEDGDVVYLRISKDVYGQGVYSARNNTWTFEYCGSINESQGSCSTIYLNGHQSFDKNKGEINVDEHTAIYKDDNAHYVYFNGRLYLTSNLSPCCFRIRFNGIGYGGDYHLLPILKKSEDMRYCQKISLCSGGILAECKDVVLYGHENFYSDYVYVCTSGTNDRRITIESDGKCFRRIIKSVSIGDSGVLTFPSWYAHSGWDVISTEIKDGFSFNTTIKQLANGDDNINVDFEDYSICEIIFDCGSDVQTGTLISYSDSEMPIYANFSNGIITVSTKAEIIEAVDDMSYMFYNLRSLKTISFDCFCTSNTCNMFRLFEGCYSLENLNLSGFDTRKVGNMYSMFRGCSYLRDLDLSSFDTSNVQNMSFMFAGCRSLHDLDLSSFDTCNVHDMSFMFSGCSLHDLDLSSFDTSNVQDMSSMFSGCMFRKIDLSNFNTSNVERMYEMFRQCHTLEALDLSSFDTRNVRDMFSMFEQCYFLNSLILGNYFVINDAEIAQRICKNMSMLSKVCYISCLESTRNVLLNSFEFPTDVSFTWNILDN